MISDTVVTFGKYKGQLLAALPEDYLLWMSRELQSKWKGLAIQALNQRNGMKPMDSSKPVTVSSLILPSGRYRGHSLGSLPDDQLQIMAKHVFSPWASIAQQQVLDLKNSKNVVDVESLKEQITKCKDIDEAKRIYQAAVECLLHKDRFIANMLIGMFGRCKSVEDARKVFDTLECPNIYSYNIMLKCYTQNGRLREAWQMFDEEMSEKNSYSWNIMLSGLANTKTLSNVWRFFARMPETDKNMVSWNILLIAYINNGQLSEARTIFDMLTQHDTITWSTMVEGYARYGHIREAREFFDRNPHTKTITSWDTMVRSYASNGFVKEAKEIFNLIPEKEITSWNALLAAYALNGLLQEAELLFSQMKSHDESSWCLLLDGYCRSGDIDGANRVLSRMSTNKPSMYHSLFIEGYARNGDIEDARRTFNGISESGLDTHTLNTMLYVYSGKGYVHETKELFDKHVEKTDNTSSNMLVSAYSLCGNMEMARMLFEEMGPRRNFYSWTAQITGYIHNNCFKEAANAFREMLSEGVDANRVALTWMLLSTGKLNKEIKELNTEIKEFNKEMNECIKFFTSITTDYDMSPTLEHYECMVRVLGLEEGDDLMRNMPLEPDMSMWITLLEHCSVHKDVQRCEKVAYEKILEMDSIHSDIELRIYGILGEVYERNGKKKELASLKKVVKSKGLMYNAWCSIEIGNKVHKFCAGDTSHPWNKQIRNELRRLNKLVKDSGYGGCTGKMDVLGLSKVDSHVERLAIAYGNIISSSKGDSLRILLHGSSICKDCHEFAKSVSKLAGRRILLRDIKHIHRFENGICSCGDSY